MSVTGQRTSWMGLAKQISDEVENEGDMVTRAHLWDVPALPVHPDDQITPGMFYDSTGGNIAGLGNTIVEVFTIPGVIMQRVTGIDSGQMATRRQYGGTWSAWKVISPA